MRIFTIGFTKSTAESFFARLREAGVERVVDVRLNNVSQLAGFAKQADLRWFLATICSIDYVHCPKLAPTHDMLDAYKTGGGKWVDYEREFMRLIRSRHIEETLPRDLLDGACLLCSEAEPHHCHRRLIAEYLKENWGEVEIVHL